MAKMPKLPKALALTPSPRYNLLKSVAMKNMSIIFIICLVPLCGFGIYLIYQNRSSDALWSKVVPALAIAIVGGFFSIWFSLKSENIENQFSSTLFFHKSDKKPLDRHYPNQHKFGGSQFGIALLNFIDKYTEQNQELSTAVFDKDIEKIRRFYQDLVFIKLISRCFWIYADWWDISINSVRRGDSFESVVSANKPKPTCSTLKWEDFLKGLNNEGDFYQLLSSFSEDYSLKNMTMPPETKVNFITSQYMKTLVFTNPFVKVSITVFSRGGSIGIGDYQFLLGYDNKKNDEFWSEYFRINCKAEFEKFRSGHPDMPIYKRWVNTMFAEIQFQLDDKKRLQRAYEYRDLIN
ncbi:MAG: hypothetical protein PHP01_07520 [Phycisphaerae bacterium]|nr:hypothetical protein [Phycisphaerae bacterium]